MQKNFYPWQKYEQGFLIILVCAAILCLYSLFSSFVLPVLFSMMIVCATYPLFIKINSKIKSSDISSGIMIVFLLFVVVLPFVYLISVSASTIFEIYQNNQISLKNINVERLISLKNDIIDYLPIGEQSKNTISLEIDKNAKIVFLEAQKILISTSKSIIDNSVSVLFFCFISLFTMFFFFRDGKNIANKIKIITPLHDYFDTLLMQELYSLCGILTVSVFSVAFLQGVAFGALTYFMDLNWLFIAVAISVASFIPFLGAFLVWGPLSIYLYSYGQKTESIIVIFWGVIITGFVIDNIVRPWITSKICHMFNKSTSLDLFDFKPLDHTGVIILSTIGGLNIFGVMGLFLGPIIAALSITIMDLYVLRIQMAEPAYQNKDLKTEKVSVDDSDDKN